MRHVSDGAKTDVLVGEAVPLLFPVGEGEFNGASLVRRDFRNFGAMLTSVLVVRRAAPAFPGGVCDTI
jgi:hypothetical protein